MIQTKKIVIVAGPNGAGKTTFATEYLSNEANVPTFLNADVIAADLNPSRPDLAAIPAGRMMLSQIDECVSKGQSFAFETTLSGRGFARAIPSWREEGYWVELYFLRMPTPGMCITRVRQRVREGGHHIPEAVIRRRFQAGWQNLESVYRAIVDDWTVCETFREEPRAGVGEATAVNEQGQGDQAHWALSRKRSSDRAMAALQRAASVAQRRALETTGSYVVYRDGRLVHHYRPREPSPQGALDVGRN